MKDGIIIKTQYGTYKLTEELIDDYIYPINLRNEIRKADEMKNNLEIPHCEKCEIFLTLKDRVNPEKGWKCPKCGTEHNAKKET